MRFEEMNLNELVAELDRFRNQIENQGFKMTEAQRRRWCALSKIYKRTSAELIK